MKVILKSEVDNLGLPGDVVDVADGYGRNFLLPRGKAIIATRGAMKEAELLTRSRKVRESETLGSATSAREVLESRSLRIAARVDDRGSLYGSVNAGDVQRVLKERGHDIPRKRIELRGNLKEIGTYEVPVQVHPQVIATVTVEVVDEEGRISLQGGRVVDAEAVEEVAAEVAEDSETEADVLAEQALEAAKEYEEQQAALDAEREEAGVDAPPTEPPTVDETVATGDETVATGDETVATGDETVATDEPEEG